MSEVQSQKASNVRIFAVLPTSQKSYKEVVKLSSHQRDQCMQTLSLIFIDIDLPAPYPAIISWQDSGHPSDRAQGLLQMLSREKGHDSISAAAILDLKIQMLIQNIIIKQQIIVQYLADSLSVSKIKLHNISQPRFCVGNIQKHAAAAPVKSSIAIYYV